jgi:hypothetical protein
LFHRFEKFIGSFPLLGHLYVVGIREKDGLGVAEGYALGISVAVITFHRHLFLDIKEGMIEGTSHDASLASNT